MEHSVALRSRLDPAITTIVSPIGRGLARVGFTPNVLTTLGLLLTVVGGGLLVVGNPVAGGWVLVAGGLMDTFDGAVARATSAATPFGAFYDSVSDRVSDGIILGSMAFWLRDQPRLLALALVALVAAEVTSYVRAKAEAIDLECQIGVLERGERAILVLLMLVLHRWVLEPGLWVLAVGGMVTVGQRVHHVWCQVDRDLPDDLMQLTAGDRAWNLAFKEAARRLYGPKNFDAAWQDMVQDPHDTAQAPDGSVHGPDGSVHGPDGSVALPDGSTQ
jgi:CDP-diacylglycerol--glycerol-3-phosphate 3-phosphatidyltransferase